MDLAARVRPTNYNVIFSDECSISMEQYWRTCYRKVGKPTKRKPKPKHLTMTPSIHQDELGPFWWRKESTGGETPKESPDLNPIEDLWHELKFYQETKVKAQNKQELVAGIKKFWARKISVDNYCMWYISTMSSMKLFLQSWRHVEQQRTFKTFYCKKTQWLL